MRGGLQRAKLTVQDRPCVPDCQESLVHPTLAISSPCLIASAAWNGDTACCAGVHGSLNDGFAVDEDSAARAGSTSLRGRTHAHLCIGISLAVITTWFSEDTPVPQMPTYAGRIRTCPGLTFGTSTSLRRLSPLS